MPGGFVQNDFVVNFTDECTLSSLSPPSRESYDVPLGTADVTAFATSSNSVSGCPDIVYTLIVPDVPNLPNFELTPNNEITVTPTLSTEMGTYELQLVACV